MPHQLPGQVLLPRCTSQIKDAIRQANRDMSDRDINLFTEILISRRYILCDLMSSPHGGDGYWRALLSHKSLDAKAYASDVKLLHSNFLEWIANVLDPSYFEELNFKQLTDGIQYIWIASPLKTIHRLDASIMERITKMLQWVSFDTKLNFRDADYSTELSIEYSNDEFEMQLQTYDSELINDLNDIVKQWCDDSEFIPEIETPHFRHGNGATTEVRRSQASPWFKCQFMAYDAKIEDYIRWRTGLYDEDFLAFMYKSATKTDDLGPIQLGFVPKSPLTNRVISPERTNRMWIQNDMQFLMDKWSHKAHLHVNLHSQDRSRDLCLEGSRTGRYDTFDYSKASDSVTNYVVSQLTRGTWLHDPLQDCRTERVKLSTFNNTATGYVEDEDPLIVELQKFAPMGSSVCFPTESMIGFAPLCELAVRLTLGRVSHPNDYWVYGDDVVIRSDCSDKLRLLSALMHYHVNDDKTWRSQGYLRYREACGMEAINGVDVTPLRISRRYVGAIQAHYRSKDNRLGPGEVLGVVDYINRLYLYGFRYLRQYVCSCFRDFPKYYQIYRIDQSHLQYCESVGIHIPSPYIVVDDGTATNFRCSRHNQDSITSRTNWYGWDMLDCYVIGPSTPKETHDNERFFLWTLQALLRDEKDAIDLLTEDGLYQPLSVAATRASLRWCHTLIPDYNSIEL